MRAAASRTSARCSTAVDAFATCGATADSRWTRSSNVSRTVSVASAFMPSTRFNSNTAVSVRPAWSKRSACTRRSSTSNRSRSSGGDAPCSTRDRSKSNWFCVAATISSRSARSRIVARTSPYRVRTSAASRRSRSDADSWATVTSRSATATRSPLRKRSSGHSTPIVARWSVPPGSSRHSNETDGLGLSDAWLFVPCATST